MSLHRASHASTPDHSLHRLPHQLLALGLLCQTGALVISLASWADTVYAMLRRERPDRPLDSSMTSQSSHRPSKIPPPLSGRDLRAHPARRFLGRLAVALAFLLGIWLVLEICMRIYLEAPLKADFYGSIGQDAVAGLQEQFGVLSTCGPGWVHLAWVADPQSEQYRIELQSPAGWETLGRTAFGSFLVRNREGLFRVWAIDKDGSAERLLGEVEVHARQGQIPLEVPEIRGDWQLLFRPHVYGLYINDHTIFRDTEGNWRLIGITDMSDGDFSSEKYFAVGVSSSFPPAEGMREEQPVADFGDLAWAPHVIQETGIYHMFWSPHVLHDMTSSDGIEWTNHQVILSAPYHKFFRDPMVLKVAQNQWLLYATARGSYFSQIDIYQSFDLLHWQYIRTALAGGLGSERNSPFSSMESPFVIERQGRYYLSLTYNNDSFFWGGILLMFKIWPNPSSYNETLVFQANNPYDFGSYHGKLHSPSLLTQLESHAAEFVHVTEDDSWYLTTAGWPWVASLTSGEVAVAPLIWSPAP
jgi:hypothetical protein